MSNINFGKLKEMLELLNLYTTTLNSFNFSKKQKLISPKMEGLGQYVLTEYANALSKEIEVEFERESNRLKGLIK
jgi:hypothetical protein